MADPPEGLTRYRLLTGPDDVEFSRRVSDALSQGYELYGSPTSSWDGTSMIAGQAVLWPES